MSDPTVLDIRRHPVKAMGGESVTEADSDARGIVGDRLFAVVDGEGRLSSGKDSRRFRRRDAIFDHRAVTIDEGVLVTGTAGPGLVGDPALDQRLSDLMGDPVRVLREDAVPHHDAAPISIVGTASLAWCRDELGVDADPLRLRMNLLVETTEPFEEEAWVDSDLAIGQVRLRVRERVLRCRMVDLAQQGVTTTTPWLKGLAVRDLCLGVYADVLRPGTLVAGASVRPG